MNIAHTFLKESVSILQAAHGGNFTDFWDSLLLVGSLGVIVVVAEPASASVKIAVHMTNNNRWSDISKRLLWLLPWQESKGENIDQWQGNNSYIVELYLFITCSKAINLMLIQYLHHPQ